MTESYGQRLKDEIEAYCESNGIDWNDSLQADADALADEFDAWFEQRPRADLINYDFEFTAQATG